MVNESANPKSFDNQWCVPLLIFIPYTIPFNPGSRPHRLELDFYRHRTSLHPDPVQIPALYVLAVQRGPHRGYNGAQVFNV